MSPEPSFDLVIVGGGAAGLAAGVFTARQAPGARVVVFDGARRLGVKILVSGGGRCNITNRRVSAADFHGGDRRVVAAVIRAFPSARAVEFFGSIGVRLHEEDLGRLFPDSNRSRDVVSALVEELRRLQVEVRTEHRVRAVRRAADGGPFEVETDRGCCTARHVVLATGGLSLPRTGSDGAGLAIAASLGHRLVETTPALVPLVLDGRFHVSLAGVSHEAAIRVEPDGASAARARGSVLWTHFGISGPAVLDVSRHWHRSVAEGRRVAVRLSFVPGSEFSDVERALMAAAGDRTVASLGGVLANRLPAAVTAALAGALGIDGSLRLAHLPREARRRLAHALTEWELPVTGSRGYNYAEVTAGGVSLSDVDARTLESRACPGLFLAGEMLDVDGRLGGFNFQWAWSSAWVAAKGIAGRLQGSGIRDRRSGIRGQAEGGEAGARTCQPSLGASVPCVRRQPRAVSLAGVSHVEP